MDIDVAAAVPLGVPLREVKQQVEIGRELWKPGVRVPGVRPWVQEAWRDMARRGVPEKRVPTNPINRAELEARQQDPMIAPIISMVQRELTGRIEGMFAVADPDGCLLMVGGEKRAQYLAKMAGLDLGVKWSSSGAGINGIGVVIEHRAPAQIIADEHWCHDQKGLVCTVVPVFVARKFVAAINITEPWQAARRTTLFMLNEFAEKVQRELARERRVHEARIREATRLVERSDGPALVVNKTGQVLAPEGAARINLPDRPVAGVHPELTVTLDFSDPGPPVGPRARRGRVGPRDHP